MAIFEKRRGKGIFFVSDGQTIKRQVKEGDYVTLRIRINPLDPKTLTVQVKGVHIIDGSHFSGELYGFVPSHASQCQGLKIGDKVEFDEDHVFSCDGV